MIKDTLDVAWTAKKSVEAVFEARALCEDIYNYLSHRISEIERCDTSKEKEADTATKAVVEILNRAKLDMETHIDFIGWRQP